MGTSVSREDELKSIPALLIRNATQMATLPAYREKELGIWQTWTWSQVQEEVQALALGLLELGINKGDFIAIIGHNRPCMYWSMAAAQYVGAVPVPLYEDAVAEEMVYVLSHCGARFIIAADQEQVDKVIEIQDHLPQFEHMIYVDPRGLRRYTHANLYPFKTILIL